MAIHPQQTLELPWMRLEPITTSFLGQCSTNHVDANHFLHSAGLSIVSCLSCTLYMYVYTLYIHI